MYVYTYICDAAVRMMATL